MATVVGVWTLQTACLLSDLKDGAGAEDRKWRVPILQRGSAAQPIKDELAVPMYRSLLSFCFFTLQLLFNSIRSIVLQHLPL